MSRHGELTQVWGDGEYTFRLGYGEIVRLEEFCDLGARLIAIRLSSPDCRHKDVRETIRLGLIGGGMSQGQALDKVRKFVEDYEGDAVSWEENCILALAIVAKSILPPKDQKPKKAAGRHKRKAKATTSQEEKQTSPDSSVSPL